MNADTVLYGNGITLAITSSLRNIPFCRGKEYLLRMNDYFHYLFSLEWHRHEYRDFLKTFNPKPYKYFDQYEKGRKFCNDYEREIVQFGFEATIAKHLFEGDQSKIKESEDFWYGFPNFWYRRLSEEILFSQEVQNVIENFACQFKRTNAKRIFTLNFDLLLDQYLSVEHLHGRFILPYMSYKDLIIPVGNGKKHFHRRYLFGTNGFEKMKAIETIQSKNIKSYDYDFFFDPDLDLGTLLIVGVSFMVSEVLPQDFLCAHPEYHSFDLIKLPDGHLIEKLQLRFKARKLSKIYLAYYTDHDRTHFEEILARSPLEKITTLIPFQAFL